jgi:hypothetical protein
MSQLLDNSIQHRTGSLERIVLTVSSRQQRQRLDLPVLTAPNAVNRDKRPSRLVRIE